MAGGQRVEDAPARRTMPRRLAQQPAEEREDARLSGDRPAALGVAGGGVDLARPAPGAGVAPAGSAGSARCRRRLAAGPARGGITGGSRVRSRQVSAEVGRGRSGSSRGTPLVRLVQRRGRPRRGRPGRCASRSSWLPAAATRPSCEQHDLVGVVQPQRRDGGHDRGAAAAVAGDPLGDPRLGVRVDGRGGLDQHQDRRSTARARASTTRWRWPPDRPRPRSSSCPASRRAGRRRRPRRWRCAAPPRPARGSAGRAGRPRPAGCRRTAGCRCR